MARCGCNTAMSTTCEAIMSCIAANLGPGLDFNEATGQLELQISTDAGNVAQIGSDDGFYSPAASPPGPMNWPKTVATLPAQVMAASEGSGLVIPSTSPLGIEHTISNDIDIYTANTFTLADGVAFDHLDDRTDPINRYVDNPSAITWRNLGTTNLPSLNYDAGTRVSPTARNAPAAFTDPDGGWGGFYSHPYTPMTISELLRTIRGRAVLTMFVRFEGLGPADDAEAVASVQSVVNAVVDAGAQDWCIIMPQDNYDDGSRTPLDAMMAVVTGAGITGGLNIFADSDNTNPWTPAEIVASGATWVDIASPSHPSGVDAARITELVNAGLEVMVFTDARHYWTDWAFDLGARAIRCRDAVYARGGRGQAGDVAYRQTFIPGLETRTAVNGGITPLNAYGTAVFDQGFARQDTTGRWFAPRYGWQSGVIRWENHQLLGTISPYPNTTDYRIAIRARVVASTPSSSNQHVGIFFAMPDDHDFSWISGVGSSSANGYYAALSRESSSTSSRQLFIRRFNNGGFTTLASETNTISLPTDSWALLEVVVQGTSITFNATVGGTTRTLAAEDSTHRGAYAAYAWRDEQATSVPGFIHGYTNPVDLVMYEALS